MATAGEGGRARQTWRTLQDSPAFASALLFTLAAAAFNGLLVALMALRLEAVLPAPFAQMSHFTEPHHRTHDLTFGLLFLPTVVGILAQLRRPSRNVASMLMALTPTVGLSVTLLLTLLLAGNAGVLQPPWVLVGAAALIAMSLHPAGRDFFDSVRWRRANPVMLAGSAVAAGPAIVLAATNVIRQATVADDHAAAGHYGFMAGFAFAIVLLSLLASLRPAGWRLTAWIAGLLPVLLALTSIVYPEATSSLSRPWAVAATLWGLAYLAAAQVSRDPDRRTDRARDLHSSPRD